MRKRIKEDYGFKPATVTTYTVLYRLEREGLLEKNNQGLYNVTSKGRKMYREAITYLKQTVTSLESALTSN